ncbi:extracellular solute-binding protein [Actinoplanes derwentensis]|uniref:Carbohydrate ABC transporter substrate-binding protein, CUT1 family n=1 Tax=Actinoplanes derwentensis TaxID=113562 RepID=A0A1H1YXS2_9ACTN|nr:extracellular solute-binding protein [Actinoplanes derwentensis]GID81335.1 sugar ABC transporter substrate-binding protein [Actinoplanes derwentensis]SDT26152.1 carbohydrate ABC transporter substrate-binding protein, CUT1 family [Actinoplanes derwentensis]
MLDGRPRRGATGTVLILFASVLTGCAADGGANSLTYYIADAAQEDVATRCAAESGGAYTFDIQRLPNTAAGGREQLLRRLAAEDRSMDIVSVDPPFMAEFANAGFLRAFTAPERQEFSAGVLDGPLEQSTFRDVLWAAPLYGNTQLLWYRKSVLAEAGVDPSAGPVTWDQLIQGATRAGVTVAAQGRRNESLMVWVNALVASAGGSILQPGSENLPSGQVKGGLNTDAGAEAARIMHDLAVSPAAPAGLSTSGEEDSRSAFQAEDGGFMVNWPYVWAAFDSAIEEGTLPANFKDDVGWAAYPRVRAGTEAASPSGGLGLSISAFSGKPDLAVEAIRCLASEQSQKEFMTTAGNPAALGRVFDDPEIRELFPMADQIRTGLDAATPRPVSPYYGDVTGSVQTAFHPPGSLDPGTTPREANELLEAVLSNQRLI